MNEKKHTPVTDVDVTIHGSGTSLGFKTKDARYHVWLIDADSFTFKPPLYKNSHAKYGTPQYFITRKLDPTAITNAAMIAFAIAEARKLDLLSLARQKEADKETARLKEAKEAADLERIREAAPDLLAALEEIAKGKGSFEWGGEEELPIERAVRIAKQAIALAGAGKEAKPSQR